MGLVIYEHEHGSRPVLQCDFCLRIIENHKEAIVQHVYGGKDGICQLYVTCKMAVCNAALEKRLGGHTRWMPVDAMMTYLFRNLEMDDKHKRDYEISAANMAGDWFAGDDEEKKTKNRTHPERAKMSPKMRFFVLHRDKFQCVYCGRKSPEVVLHVDHIQPVARGGKSDLDNLVTSCRDCNAGKHTRLLESNPRAVQHE
jgi:hypothetical protein